MTRPINEDHRQSLRTWCANKTRAVANLPPEPNGYEASDLESFTKKSQEERDKRIKAEGLSQYIDIRRSEKYKKFVEDPWVGHNDQIIEPVANDGHCKVVIAGAGFGGILFAVRMIRAGIRREDILLVDPAGGFGGTWYWNRYPGLMCDVESYIYLPLLEETGYVPKRRYASGYEIREYLESICRQYGLHERAMFQSSIRGMNWNEKTREWDIKIRKQPKGGEQADHLVHANFGTIAPGVLTHAKLPDVPGIESFEGHMFHTARWDYNYTKGEPANPTLTGLRGKRVAIVGTGATCIQACPEVAKWAEKLYVFQRTPSSVDFRDNRDTDLHWFKNEVATEPGWQRARVLNFTDHVENLQPKPSKDLVDDGWTKMASYSGLIGTAKPVTMENVKEHVQQLHAIDYPRQKKIHDRIEDTVKDQKTAEKLKPWYAGWCKRPCFHDDYLEAFNLPNVELIDTEGSGLDCVTENGIRAGGEDYAVDVIIWSTGFRSPTVGSAGEKADITVTGRNGLDMEEQSQKSQLLTLHGVLSRGFPNLLGPAMSQGGVSANFTFILDTSATHAAYIVSQAMQKANKDGKPVVEPTSEAQEEWAQRIASGAATFAGVAGCTPSYLNKEGEIDQMTNEEKMTRARLGIWPHGFESYLNLLEDWRAQGTMDGLEVY